MQNRMPILPHWAPEQLRGTADDEDRESCLPSLTRIHLLCSHAAKVMVIGVSVCVCVRVSMWAVVVFGTPHVRPFAGNPR